MCRLIKFFNGLPKPFFLDRIIKWKILFKKIINFVKYNMVYMVYIQQNLLSSIFYLKKLSVPSTRLEYI